MANIYIDMPDWVQGGEFWRPSFQEEIFGPLRFTELTPSGSLGDVGWAELSVRFGWMPGDQRCRVAEILAANQIVSIFVFGSAAEAIEGCRTSAQLIGVVEPMMARAVWEDGFFCWLHNFQATSVHDLDYA